VISNKLREKCGVSVELYRLYKAAEEGTIKMRGHGFSFEKIRDQVYSQLASTIANDLDRLWADDWDIDTIILTGGGCRELAKYLHPLITGNVIPIDSSTDARLNNVLGYAKYGRYIWGEAAIENPAAKSAGEPIPEPATETIETIDENELSQV
ncbi:MAG: hypothetical protein OET21_20325, partial [Desulfobacterales bacterium]|nr:hypothetical protein [Desulfobacterales bacterium]